MATRVRQLLSCIWVTTKGGNGLAEYDLTVLARRLDNYAKWWWGASQLLKVGAFGVGSAAVFGAFSAATTPFVVAILGIAWELAIYRSDHVKGMAQSLRRRLDMRDGMGWEIAPDDIADLLIRCPAAVKDMAKGEIAKEPYFASDLDPGQMRLLEITRESAWWSKHLTGKLSRYCLAVFVAATALSIAGLIVALYSSAALSPIPGTDYAAIARVVTSVLTLVLSLGTVKLALGYRDFERKSAKVEETANLAMQRGATSDVEAIKIAHEYALARSSAPMIPEWIWETHQRELNELWATYKRSTHKS